jgi:hypothetical protein
MSGEPLHRSVPSDDLSPVNLRRVRQRFEGRLDMLLTVTPLGKVRPVLLRSGVRGNSR